MYRLKGALLALITLFIITGCGGGGGTASTDGNTFVPQAVPTGSATPIPSVIAKFDPLTGQVGDIPLPNQLLSNPTTGFNNLPGTGQPYTSFNAIQGFSTSAPVYLPFSGTLDPATVTTRTVVLYDVQGQKAASYTLSVNDDNTANTHYVVLTPTVPLNPSTVYMVFVSGVKAKDGTTVGSSTFMNLMKSTTTNNDSTLEALRKSWQPIWAVGERLLGTSRDNIAESFKFTTQPIGVTLSTLRTAVQAGTPTFTLNAQALNTAQVDTFYQTLGLGKVPHGNVAMVFKGTFTSPNYVVNPLTTGITFTNGQPVTTGSGNVPFLATYPANKTGPVPVIIYQHGINGTKYQMLIVADAAARAGFGMIAIDAVLHGERSAVINGVQQPSGTGFFNVGNPLLVRDNFYQTYSDMYGESALITKGKTNFTGATPLFATIAKQGFVGVSLGAIMGGTFVATEPNAQAAVLNVPGARIAYLLNASPAFQTDLVNGLAALGIKQGTLQYTLFLWLVQTVLDDIDPFNYGPGLITGTRSANVAHNVLVQEMINDQVVPNSATEDLVRAIAVGGAFYQVNPVAQVIVGLTATNAPYLGSGIFQYTGGAHGFLLDPNQGPTTQAQLQAINYIGTFFQTGSAQIINPFTVGKSEPADWNTDVRFDNPHFIWP